MNRIFSHQTTFYLEILLSIRKHCNDKITHFNLSKESFLNQNHILLANKIIFVFHRGLYENIKRNDRITAILHLTNPWCFRSGECSRKTKPLVVIIRNNKAKSGLCFLSWSCTKENMREIWNEWNIAYNVVIWRADSIGSCS